jgi:hypothetical protein
MHSRARRSCAVIGTATITLVLGLISMSAASAMGATPPVVAGVTCIANTFHATVSFRVSNAPRSVVTGLQLKGFDPASCDGAAVQVDLRGNPTGDPQKPAPALLSALDSTRSACTGAPLADALTIRGGAIDLATCDTAGPADVAGPPANLHDLTLLIIKIGGDQTAVSVGASGTTKCGPGQPRSTCVLGEKVTRNFGSTGTNTGSDSSVLPFTGAWVALGLAVGFFALLLGIVLALLRRRRPVTAPR